MDLVLLVTLFLVMSPLFLALIYAGCSETIAGDMIDGFFYRFNKTAIHKEKFGLDENDYPLIHVSDLRKFYFLNPSAWILCKPFHFSVTRKIDRSQQFLGIYRTERVEFIKFAREAERIKRDEANRRRQKDAVFITRLVLDDVQNDIDRIREQNKAERENAFDVMYKAMRDGGVMNDDSK